MMRDAIAVGALAAGAALLAGTAYMFSPEDNGEPSAPSSPTTSARASPTSVVKAVESTTGWQPKTASGTLGSVAVSAHRYRTPVGVESVDVPSANIDDVDETVDASDVEEMYLEMDCDDLNKIVDVGELLKSLPDVNDVESDVKRQLLVKIKDKLEYCGVIARARARADDSEIAKQAREVRMRNLNKYKMYGKDLRRDMGRRIMGQDWMSRHSSFQ